MGFYIIDGHCDSICDAADRKRDLLTFSGKGHLDIPRLRSAGIGAQVMAMFVDDAYLPAGAIKRVITMIDALYRLQEASGEVVIAITSEALEKARREGKTGLIMAIEGGEALEGSIEALRVFHRLGVRMMTLTWSRRNQIADGVNESDTGSRLTNFGRRVIAEMDSLGMVIDLSHISPSGFWDVMDRVEGPVVCSHSNAKSLCSHRRNLTDDQLKAVAKKGGVVGACFYTPLIDDNPSRRDIGRLLDHIEYMADVMGPEHVALGSDYDGIDETPKGLEDITKLPALADGLSGKGLSDEAIRGIMGENWLSVFKKVWR